MKKILLASILLCSQLHSVPLCEPEPGEIRSGLWIVGGTLIFIGGTMCNVSGMRDLMIKPQDHRSFDTLGIEYGTFCMALGAGMFTYGMMKRRALYSQQVPSTAIAIESLPQANADEVFNDHYV